MSPHCSTKVHNLRVQHFQKKLPRTPAGEIPAVNGISLTLHNINEDTETEPENNKLNRV